MLLGKCEPLKCMTNVEICSALGCDKDRGCYLSQDVDYEAGTGVARPVCAVNDPCPSPLCQNCSQCIPMRCGFLPPYSLCTPKSYPDPCDNFYCPEGYSCRHNYATCYGWPCKVEAACVNLDECKHCKPGQSCDIVDECEYTYKGICSGKQ